MRIRHRHYLILTQWQDGLGNWRDFKHAIRHRRDHAATQLLIAADEMVRGASQRDTEQGNHALLWAESAAHDLARGAIKPETIKTMFCVGWRLTLMVTDNSDAMVAYLDKGSRHG